jgi:hypothetical protein
MSRTTVIAVVCVTAVIVGCAGAVNALFGSERTSHAGVRGPVERIVVDGNPGDARLTASGADDAAVTGR